MTTLLYAFGYIYVMAAFFVTTPLVAAISAAFYLSNPLMSKLLTNQGYGWYAYFAATACAFGIYLFSIGSLPLAIAGLSCFVGAIVTLLAGKPAIAGYFFHHQYDQFFAVTHPVIMVSVLFYLLQNLK